MCCLTLESTTRYLWRNTPGNASTSPGSNRSGAVLPSIVERIVDHHKISPRGEPGVFVGLGTADNKKAWLVYCPRINRVFASRDVQFDETFFPLRTVDQRVFGNYDADAVQELRAANQYVTLDQQAPSIATSDVWDPSLARMALESNHLPPVGIDDAGSRDNDVMSDDGSAETP
eukprot:314339-Rhodomonas_salina.1